MTSPGLRAKHQLYGQRGAVVRDITRTGVLAVGVGTARAYNDTGRTLTVSKIRVSVGNSGTAGSTVVDVNKNGTTLFADQATRPTMPFGTPTVVASPAAATWEDGTYLTVDIDAIATGADTLTVSVTAL